MDKPIYTRNIDQAAIDAAVASGLGQRGGKQILAQVTRSSSAGPITWVILEDGSEQILDANGQAVTW